MKKKTLLAWTVATAMLGSCAFALCACVKDEPKETPSTYTVSIGEEAFIMTVGDEKFLIPEFSGQASSKLTYASSDESVVAVDENGKLTAIKVGTATITVRYGDAVDTCEVTVSLNDMLPLLQLTNVSETEIRMYKSSELDLSGTVLFNEKTYDDVTLTYEVSEPDVGKIENGVFKPSTTGKTDITVSATWRGVSDASMAKTITVEVVPEFLFTVNEGVKEITLYTKEDKSSPFVVTAEYDGSPLTTSIEVTAGNGYISYDANKNEVKSLGIVGEAEITISYTLENELVEQKIPVHVKPTVYNYESTVTNFSAIHGDAVTGTSLKTILGGDILSAYDAEGNPLEVKNNKVYGVQSSNDGKFETEISIYSVTCGYKLNIEGYSGVFAKAEDFAVFYTNASYASVDGSRKFRAIDATKPMQKWEGYYVLANNIDASEYEHATVGVELSKRGIQSGGYGDVGFHGTFDGQGYTVKGMTVGAYGIFGYLCEATLKNVAFADVTLKKDVADSSVLAAWIMDSTVSNVYISIANESKLSTAGTAFACGVNNSEITACIVETKAGFGYADGLSYTGSFTYMNKERTDGDAIQSRFVDVFVISGEMLGYYKNSSSYYYFQADNETLSVPEGREPYTLEGVKRYATLADMQADTKNKYTYFNSTYWTVTNGVPVWNSLNGYYPPITDDNDQSSEKQTVGDFNVDWLS